MFVKQHFRSFRTVSSITFCCLTVALPARGNPIQADSTLPIPSAAACNGNSCTISNGTTAGSNLFHSFTQFSVPAGGTAYFNNAPTIQNIFSRVTGATSSNIDGLLKANGTANLFVVNPNGIIFGPNAKLEIGGSFLASTATSVKFADRAEFSATNPHSQPLLTVSVPVGLQLENNPGQIQVQGSSLQVVPGKTLALVGGEVAIAGGQLTAFGGRIELGSVAGGGLVNLAPIDKGWTLGYQNVRDFGDIHLYGGATLDTSGLGSGDLQLFGKRITLTDGSRLLAVTVGSVPGGGITVNATESVELIGDGGYDQFVPKYASGNVEPNELRNGFFALTLGSGTGGNIAIDTPSFIARNGTYVSATTFGTGRGGNATLNASNVVDLTASFVATGTGSAGDSGDLTVNTGRLIARDNGILVTSTTLGSGKGGNLTVNARESIELIGGNPIQLGPVERIRIFSGFFTSTLGSGDAGHLHVNTGRLVVRDGGGLAATTFGQGSGGNLTVNASKLVELTGSSPNGQIVSSFTVLSEFGSTGNAGNLTVNAGQLIVSGGAVISSETASIGQAGNLTVRAADFVELSGTSADNQVSSSLTARTRGSGTAGHITIDTGKLIVRDGASLSTATLGSGQGGKLTVNASSGVEVTGADRDGKTFSTLSASSRGTGDAGNITIATNRLKVSDGADVSVTAFGSGRSGELAVTASESVELLGARTSPDGKSFSRSGLFAATEGTREGGDLTVTTPRLLVNGGARVSVSTRGRGDGDRPGGKGGNLTIRAPGGVVELSGTSADGRFKSGLFALSGEERPNIKATEATGDGGDLEIEADRLIVGDRAEISVSALGSGKAGNLRVQARSIVLDNGSIVGLTASGEGANITLQQQNIQLRRGSNIATDASGTATGGNINLNADAIIVLENSQITTNAFKGRGGNIQINTQGLFRSPDSAVSASSNLGVDGVVEIKTPDVQLQNSLVQESVKFIDPEQVVANSCIARRNVKQGSFTVTGTGGLPPTPYDAPMGRYSVVGVRSLGTQEQRSPAVEVEKGRNSNSQSSKWKLGEPIEEARGMVVTENGRIVLGSGSQLVAIANAKDLVCDRTTQPD